MLETLKLGVEDGDTEIKALVEVTWQELKGKRDAGELIPGAQYRITDYLVQLFKQTLKVQVISLMLSLLLMMLIS